jgi:hypothetical protein
LKFTFQKENLFSATNDSDLVSVASNKKVLLRYYVGDIRQKCSFQYKFSYKAKGERPQLQKGVTKVLGQGLSAVLCADYGACKLTLSFTSESNTVFTVAVAKAVNIQPDELTLDFSNQR